MNSDSMELAKFITATIQREVAESDTITGYREPLVAFVAADDSRFADLRRVIHPTHMLPSDLLPRARSVISFFLPFDYWVVEANAEQREEVAREWVEAYLETNALISRITDQLVVALVEQGIRAAAEPPTYNFDPVTMVSRWSHKSVAVIAGLASFGLHHLIITDSGCAGRSGSLVIDADLPITPTAPKERCLYFHDGSCLECVLRCPVDALDESGPIDKHRCYRHLQGVAKGYERLGLVEVCGKCAIGPCSFESAVQ